jgi:chaperonin cofactor prefoldin
MVTTNQEENEIKNLKNQINILNERVLNLENKLEKLINDNNTN